MNSTIDFYLRRMHRNVYLRLGGKEPNFLQLSYIDDRKEANRVICEMLERTDPCMVARFGSNELTAITNYLGVMNPQRSYWKYIKNEVLEWWWSPEIVYHMQSNAGFFPSNEETLTRYAELCLEDAQEVDVLGSWQKREYYLNPFMVNLKHKVRLRYLEPYFFSDDASKEWTQLLRGKNVLVIHPFVDTIRKQYAKRQLLFKDPNLLPEFNLLTLKAVQSIGGDNAEFATWFDALDWMKHEIDKINFDIAIIGCGAYGFNLAAYIKRKGKKAIHLGGATQLLFGIKGRRWEENEDYHGLYNENWCRPSENERPMTASKVENGCYW